jgi:predicted nuclease with TOPRIM domain
LLEQIENLQSDTAGLNLRIAALQTQNANLQNELNTANGTISSLQTQNTNLQNQLNTCEDEKDNLQELLDACLASGIESVQSVPLKIYPNPVQPNSTLNIENETFKAGDKLEIFDMNGKIISINFATGIENSINIGALPQGTYLLRLAGKQGVKFEVR